MSNTTTNKNWSIFGAVPSITRAFLLVNFSLGGIDFSTGLGFGDSTMTILLIDMNSL